MQHESAIHAAIPVASAPMDSIQGQANNYSADRDEQLFVRAARSSFIAAAAYPEAVTSWLQVNASPSVECFNARAEIGRAQPDGFPVLQQSSQRNRTVRSDFVLLEHCIECRRNEFQIDFHGYPVCNDLQNAGLFRSCQLMSRDWQSPDSGDIRQSTADQWDNYGAAPALRPGATV